MKTYLVEAYSDEIEFEKDSLIVALTPEVCYRLDKKGIKYSIVEDYYDAIEATSRVEEHRKSVFRWIDEFDEFLLKNIEGLDVKPATIYRWYLKGMVIDPLYVRCHAINHLFKETKPTEVVYFTQKPLQSQLNYTFEHYGRSLYSQVIPIICREKNIPLTTVFPEAKNGAVEGLKSPIRKEKSATALKNLLFKSTGIKRLYFIYRYVKSLPKFNKAKHNKKNLFLLMATYIGEDFIAEAICRGHNVFLLSGDTILKYSWFGTRKYSKLALKSGKTKSTDLESAADLLANHRLVAWFNEKCQMDVSEIVIPRLRHFILTICPELVRYIDAFAEFYKETDINVLFTPVVASLPDYAALAAANQSPKIKTACLVHGDAVYDSRVWNMTELENYDIHISSNIEMTEYFSDLAKEIHSSARTYSNPHRWRNIKKIANLREKRGDRVIIKNRIIYVPTIFMGDYRRFEGNPDVDTWYYRFQKSLINYFVERDDFTFIWKGLPEYEHIYDPIPDYIRDNDFTNIEIATKLLPQYLLTADSVICDMPSTGFYEAVLVGVPTMSLCHRAFIVRRGGSKYFGNLLKFFTDIPEAIKSIEDFLNGDPHDYLMKIDLEEGSLFDIFEEKGE